jgi:hypothetical protein
MIVILESLMDAAVAVYYRTTATTTPILCSTLAAPLQAATQNLVKPLPTRKPFTHPSHKFNTSMPPLRCVFSTALHVALNFGAVRSVDLDAAQKWTMYDRYHHVASRPDQTERSRELEY